MGASEHGHGGNGRTSLGLGFSAVRSAKKTMSELKRVSGFVRSSRSHTIANPFPLLREISGKESELQTSIYVRPIYPQTTPFCGKRKRKRKISCFTK
jgi:hypothetical protein